MTSQDPYNYDYCMSYLFLSMKRAEMVSTLYLVN